MSKISAEWGEFIQETQDLYENFCAFFSKNRALRWFAVFIIVIVYGSRIIYGDYFIDSEIMLSNPSEMLYSWYGIGRFGLVLTKKLFSLTRLVPYLSAILLVIALWCLSIFFCFCFTYWGNRGNEIHPGNFLFVLFFLSAPCFAEQFNFILQAFEICFAMILCVIAAFTAGLVFYEKKSIFWLAPSFMCLVWSIGSYQAFNTFYIAVVAISFIGTWLSKESRCGILTGVKQAGWYIFGFIGSSIAGNLLSLRAGANSSYVNSMFFWQTESIWQCIENIQVEFVRMYQNGWPLFYRKGLLLLSIFFLIMVVFFAVRVIKRNQRQLKDITGLMISICIFLISPMMMTLITGMNQPLRAQFTFPLVYAFLIASLFDGLLTILWNNAHLQSTVKTVGKSFCVLTFAFGIFIGWQQCVDTSQLFETAHESFNQDVRLAQSIYDRILEVESGEETDSWRVAFVGSRNSYYSGPAVVGDVIGRSYFSWDTEASTGISSRAVGFMNTLGFTLSMPDVFDFQKAVEAGVGKPSWPDINSVFKVEDGLICVKLSDY